MKINVGSKNPVKVDAVKETISEYNIFSGAEVLPVDVSRNGFLQSSTYLSWPGIPLEGHLKKEPTVLAGL